MTRFSPLLVWLLTACAGPALLNTVARNPDRDTTVVSDIPYGQGDRQKLDLYLPSDSAPGAVPRPILMFVHGGSWADGDKESYAFAGQRYAAEGFVTAVPSYRVVPDGAYPAFMEDIAAALATTLDEASANGADPERVYLVGHSAGAYNVVQLALAPRFLAVHDLTPSIIDAVAGLSGPYDFDPNAEGALQAAFGPGVSPADVLPVNLVTEDSPPMILITGGADTVVEPRNSRLLAEKLEAADVDAKVVIYEDADHVAPIVAVAFPKRYPVVADTTSFFARHGSGLPTADVSQ